MKRKQEKEAKPAAKKPQRFALDIGKVIALELILKMYGVMAKGEKQESAGRGLDNFDGAF